MARKHDMSRIALKQKHEVQYLRKIAKEQKEALQTGEKISIKKLKRICRAVIKLTK